MARIRTVKPELAAHEGMFDLERETGLPVRFAWVMLFTVCDRVGRFAWRPRTLKAQILPHDDLDFSRVLDAWLTRGFIVRYRVKGAWFGVIPTFTKHQVINNREAPSDLPGPDEADERIDNSINNFDASCTREPREADACSTREVHAQAEGREGRKGKGREGVHEGAEQKSLVTRTEDEWLELFGAVKAAYPKFTAGQDWLKAERAWRRLIDAGHEQGDLLAAVDRFAAYVAAGGVSGPAYVMTPGKFFESPERFYLQPWEPPKSKAETVEDETIAAGRAFLAGSSA